MYEYYRNKAKPTYRLVKRHGAPFPSQTMESEWILNATTHDVPDDILIAIKAKGYHLSKFDVTFKEIGGSKPHKRKR
jgi:hypothetical protein